MTPVSRAEFNRIYEALPPEKRFHDLSATALGICNIIGEDGETYVVEETR